MLIAVGIGIGLWVCAWIYGFRETIQDVRQLQRRGQWQPGDTQRVVWMSIFFPIATLWRFVAGVAEGTRLQRGQEPPANHLNDLWAAGGWSFLGGLLFLFGSAVMGSYLPTWQITCLALGPALIAFGFWLLRHWRHNWIRWSQERGHGRDVLLHFFGAIASFVTGFLILAAAL